MLGSQFTNLAWALFVVLLLAVAIVFSLRRFLPQMAVRVGHGELPVSSVSHCLGDSTNAHVLKVGKQTFLVVEGERPLTVLELGPRVDAPHTLDLLRRRT